MPTILKIVLITLATYLAFVLLFAGFVTYQGKSHAERGVAADEEWVALTTRDEDGNAFDSVLAGVEIEGKLYVAANHWPRAWYHRALANPVVQVTLAGEQALYRAVPVSGEAHDAVAEEYAMPFVFRLLTGFPPRRFLLLERASP